MNLILLSTAIMVIPIGAGFADPVGKGGTAYIVIPDTTYNPVTETLMLPGGAWGTDLSQSPIYQNASFTGTATSAVQGAFGILLQQNDNSSNSVGGIYSDYGVGILENLNLVGSGVVGGRAGAAIGVNINAATGNKSSRDYIGTTTHCAMYATDATTGSTCFGLGVVATIAQNVTANQLVGTEIDTWSQSGSKITDRIGTQIVDIYPGGVQASRDDVALSLNNQYGPALNYGFRYGLEFGRFGGNFPVATNGTLIFGTATGGGSWQVSNGVDWHLGSFTGNSWNDGHIQFTGAGDLVANSSAALSTNANSGFLSPPFTVGTPTGSPSQLNTACEINASTATLNCFFNKSWHHISFSPGAD